METLNGRFLPDDSDASGNDGAGSQTPGSAWNPIANSGSRRAKLRQSGPVSEPENPNITARSGREAGLPESECTIGSNCSPANQTIAENADGGSTTDADVLRKSGVHPSRYVELGELGRGGWGVVQRVLDRQLQREVALKRISSPGKIADHQRAAFLHEARITSGLQHPGVVPVHELVADAGGDTYYVMKLLEGDTLRHHIRRAHTHCPDGNWTRHLLLKAITPLLVRFVDVCNAVAYAHRCGIIHRDLKPTNVMAGGFGETIVVDWGLARYINDASDETTMQGPGTGKTTTESHRSSAPQESEGSVIGTPSYMAPEQARGELASMGSHSDIYSLGVILYEIVAGHHPHKGMKVQQVLQRARDGIFTPLAEVLPCVPKPLQAIVHTAMSPDPERRYKNVETLAEDIQNFMTGQTVSVYQESIVERSIRWCSRHRAIAATVAIAATLLMIVSTVSTVVIRAAHQEERRARLDAIAAHEEALQSLVEARDTTDTWLVDLSGSLQFHPAMTPLRDQLIQQALHQYQRMVQKQLPPLASISPQADSNDDRDQQTLTIEWLERAKCFLRIADLRRLQGQASEAKKSLNQAQKILQQLQRKDDINVSFVSRNPSGNYPSEWASQKGAMGDLIRLEQLNAVIGQTLTTEKPPSRADIIRAREWVETIIPMAPELSSQTVPSPFVCRVISALGRLEVMILRTSHLPENGSRSLFSPERLQSAVEWAYWLAEQRGEPSDLRLAETIATDQARWLSESQRHHEATRTWSQLIDHLSKRLKDSPKRSDWLQSLAHARICRAQSAAILGQVQDAAADYSESIDELERSWLLADADEFFRINLATAENNLGRLWIRGDAQQRVQARQLIQKSISTYQQLLQEQATPDVLRRLTQSHESLANLLAQLDTADAHTERRQALLQAKLGYEILSDQGFANHSDHLHWGTVLNRLLDDESNHGEFSPTATMQKIQTLVDKVQPGELSPDQRKLYDELIQFLNTER